MCFPTSQRVGPITVNIARHLLANRSAATPLRVFHERLLPLLNCRLVMAGNGDIPEIPLFFGTWRASDPQ
jgi:hypothetical protein